MVSNELKTITEKVCSLLNDYAKTRDSDTLLLEVYYQQFEEKQIKISKVITSPDTIIRLRRKLQRENPSLKATKKVQENRKEREVMFRQEMSIKNQEAKDGF